MYAGCERHQRAVGSIVSAVRQSYLEAYVTKSDMAAFVIGADCVALVFRAGQLRIDIEGLLYAFIRVSTQLSLDCFCRHNPSSRLFVWRS
jgi:hypothetical protein